MLVLGFGADEKVIYNIERLLWFVSQQRGKPVNRAIWPHEMRLLLAPWDWLPETIGCSTKNPTSNQAGWLEWTISPWPS